MIDTPQRTAPRRRLVETEPAPAIALSGATQREDHGTTISHPDMKISHPSEIGDRAFGELRVSASYPGKFRRVFSLEEK